MLTNIKIKNAYSIKELDLSFIKGKYGYKKDMTYKEIVNPMSLYGNNGSGKSSVVNALNDLLNLLIEDKENFYPIIANFSNKQEETLIELTYKLNDSIYCYSLSTSFIDSKIVREFLLVDNKPVFTRNDERIIIEDKEFLIEGNLTLGLRQLYSLLLELNSTKEDIKKSYDYLTNLTIVRGDTTINSKLCNYKNMEELMAQNSEEVKRIISKFKGVALFDFFNEKEGFSLNLYMENNHKLKLPTFLISSGMLTLNKILSIMINLDRNSILVIDGIEKNLHFSTILMLIKEAQIREIQLIFTSHNTSLMQELRPDQIYFARWKEGYSYYFRLSNIYDNIREINNIEKMYLSNTFENAINQIINIDD